MPTCFLSLFDSLLEYRREGLKAFGLRVSLHLMISA
jgi:hypothetical protein